MSYPATGEQQAAIDAFATGDDLVLQAGAGAGKTSTLKFLATAKPAKRGLYIAYNRAIKDDAARSFPRSVKCATSHGLAYGTVGRRYSHRLNGPRQPSWQVAEILGITAPIHLGDDLADLSPGKVASLALDTIRRFCFSADAQLEGRHVPKLAGMNPVQRRALAREILPFAQDAWVDIVATDGRLPFQHDHYLKIWALSNPQLEVDYLLFDEAQDANPLLTALVLAQQDCQRVAVGDSAQQIYSWRGAEDALYDFPGRQLTLSQSFRFGPAIAYEANRWLDLLSAPLRLTGYDKIGSQVGELHRPDAILCRTNAGAMAAAMEHMAHSRVAIVGGGASIKALAEAAIDLMAGQTTNHPELMLFTSWDQVRSYAQTEEEGSDLLPLVKLIDKYGADKVIRAVNGLTDERTADVTISTAHKSKGREWGTVQIADDFPEPKKNEDNDKRYIRADEARLAYVAVTRAKQVLDNDGVSWVGGIHGVTR